MIQKISHVTIYCLNQDSAKHFYVDLLGMEVRTDVKMDNGFRWLTVGPKAQQDLEIALMEIKPGMNLDEAKCKTLRELVQSGTFGAGVLETADCRKMCEDLKKAGMRIASEPQPQPYAKLEAVNVDDSGNWLSLCER
jgi:catechol 2,3-dioxygenase-like lactoylglutathione lyase family enzyme